MTYVEIKILLSNSTDKFARKNDFRHKNIIINQLTIMFLLLSA